MHFTELRNQNPLRGGGGLRPACARSAPHTLGFGFPEGVTEICMSKRIQHFRHFFFVPRKRRAAGCGPRAGQIQRVCGRRRAGAAQARWRACAMGSERGRPRQGTETGRQGARPTWAVVWPRGEGVGRWRGSKSDAADKAPGARAAQTETDAPSLAARSGATQNGRPGGAAVLVRGGACGLFLASAEPGCKGADGDRGSCCQQEQEGEGDGDGDHGRATHMAMRRSASRICAAMIRGSSLA